MIDPQSQLGRLCGAAADLPLAPLYTFESGREAAVALARTLVAKRPQLLDDAEQTALLTLWELTSGGTAEVEFDAVKRAVQRAVRTLVSECVERRRHDGEPPPYSVDFAAVLDPERYETTKQKQTLQQLVRLAERYGVERIVTFTRLRYGTKQRRFSSEGAGRRSGIAKDDARHLDLALRRVNPAYQQVIEKRRTDSQRTKGVG